LQDVAIKLSKFGPTKIAVERLAKDESLTDEKFAVFTAEQLKTSKDERVQIGYRLASLLLHSKVFAIDEDSDEIDYFPYDKVQKFAQETGRTDHLNNVSATIEKQVKDFEQSQSKKTIAELLMVMNLPESAKQDQQIGY
jgi:hypothetical protein